MNQNTMHEIPHERHATGHDDQLITTELAKETGEAYRVFGIKCPNAIKLPAMGLGNAKDSE